MDSELSFGHRRIRKATRLALGACLLVLLAPPGPALAADVVVAGGVLSFSNANGELNDVTVSVAGATYTVDDTAGGLSAGGGCSLVNTNRVTCPAAGVTAASVELGSGSDMIAVTTPVPTTISGKGGADTITTGAGTYTIDAGSGKRHDRLRRRRRLDHRRPGNRHGQLFEPGGARHREPGWHRRRR